LENLLRDTIPVSPFADITDDVMPGRWGGHLCAELRSRPATAAVPIIMLGDNLVVDALKAGADVVLRKPASPEVIIGWTNKLLANHEAFKRANRAEGDD
jgi:DNA-binding response OmpR family regulator